MPKKDIIYQGLSDLSVLIEDTSLMSPDYFRITKMPAEFTAGVNVFKFKGNASLFAEDTSVYIEIIDSNGDPIYYETDLDLESAEQSAIVSVFINEDTPPGEATIYLCSTAKKSASGQYLNTSAINLRWQRDVNIDVSKRNIDEIIFASLPKVSISSSTGSYTNLGYVNGSRVVSQSISNLEYRYVNDQAVLFTSSITTSDFRSTAVNTQILISYTDISNKAPREPGSIDSTLIFSSSISAYSGSGIAYLNDPISFSVVNAHFKYLLKSATVNATAIYEQSASLSSQNTENSHNLAVASFSGLQPQIGTVTKIRSYYRSAGVGEYILSNETDISKQADEFGFTPDSVTVSFYINTVHRNDYLDFKFEFINPAGFVSKQIVESVNHLFSGGNSYIGGDDNLLTGSLYVAGATGTGVHISGKGDAAMIRSIGYTGFYNATHGLGKSGFVIYSGSVQPLLSASESYSGVGIELVANSESYFRYATANGGMLDIRTNAFYFGNSSSYISSSNGQLSIHTDDFDLDEQGHVTASAILVEKTIGTEVSTMIDTGRAILDATNLGRTLYQDQSEYDLTIVYERSFILYPDNIQSSLWPIGTFVFQGLKNEINYLVSYQSKIEVLGSTVNIPHRVILVASMSFQSSGSASDTSFYGFSSPANSDYPSGSNNRDIGGITLTGFFKTGSHAVSANATTYTHTRTFSENAVVALSLINTGSIAMEKYQGKLAKFDIAMFLDSYNIAVGNDVYFKGTISNITVTAGRGLASAFNTDIARRQVIGGTRG